MARVAADVVTHDIARYAHPPFLALVQQSVLLARRLTINRNDACPCGSGRKYKQCCLDADSARARALRLVMAAGIAPPDTMVRPTLDALRAIDEFSTWELDALPIAADLSPSPNARAVVLLLVVDGTVLDAALESAPPSEPAEVATWMERWLRDAVARHRTQSQVELPLPERVQVRHASVAALLDRTLSPRTRVTSAWSLPGLDQIASGLRAIPGSIGTDVVHSRRDGLVLLTDPTTWAAWKIDDAARDELLQAAVQLYAAAPWTQFRYDEAITVQHPYMPDALWTACVIGADSEQRGLVLYECEADLSRAMSADTPQDDFLGLEGTVISLFLDARALLPRPMQQEFAQLKWWPIGDDAYPSMSVANSPAGGISRAQVVLLTNVLRAISGLAADHEAIAEWRSVEATPPGAPLVYQDETGLTLTWHGTRAPEAVVLWVAPTVLTSGWASGAAADPQALFPRDGLSEAALEAQFARELLRVDRFNAWLGTPRGERTRARAQETHARYVEYAMLFTEHLAFGHGVTLPAIHELHLRQFLYAWVPEQLSNAARELPSLLLALRQYFIFLESEGLRCTWADALLDDAHVIEERIATARSTGDPGRAPMWWHDQLNADLHCRVMAPEPLLPDDATGENDSDDGDGFIGEREVQLMDLLQSAHLGWREAAIAEGVSSPDAVRARCSAHQRLWESTTHVAFGKSPIAVIRQERRKSARPR